MAKKKRPSGAASKAGSPRDPYAGRTPGEIRQMLLTEARQVDIEASWREGAERDRDFT